MLYKFPLLLLCGVCAGEGSGQGLHRLPVDTCFVFVQVRGLDGARNLAETLRSRGVKKLEFVSDEGLTVLNDVVPGIKKPVAVYVGINMTVFVFFLLFSLYTRHSHCSALLS